MSKQTLALQPKVSFLTVNDISHLEGSERFDRDFVEFLKQQDLPFIDLLGVHAADFKASSLSPSAYTARHYIGHYNPTGNSFTARAIRGKVVSFLTPPSPAYDSQVTDYWKKK